MNTVVLLTDTRFDHDISVFMTTGIVGCFESFQNRNRHNSVSDRYFWLILRHTFRINGYVLNI